MARSLKIKKGDTALVLSGKDKGTTGKVLAVHPAAGTVLVEGVNMVHRHRKARSQTQPGGIFHQEAPIAISKTMVVCPKCGKGTRVGHKIENGEKIRVCKKCGADL